MSVKVISSPHEAWKHQSHTSISIQEKHQTSVVKVHLLSLMAIVQATESKFSCEKEIAADIIYNLIGQLGFLLWLCPLKNTSPTRSRQLSMAPPRKRQKVSTASQSTTTSLSRNISAASTRSTPPHTPPSQSRPSPPQGAGIFTPEHVKHLIANLDVERM